MRDQCTAEHLPLRLSAGRFRLYAVGLTLVGIAQILHSGQWAFWDWSTFAYAAAHVGSASLLHPERLPDAFVYLPGAAWALAPLRTMPLATGFALNAVLMLAASIAAAFTARRIYRLSAPVCLALILAWAPTTDAILIGQNAPIGLLLMLLSMLGFTRSAPMLTALPVGLLLYKPTYAIPLIGILILRKRNRELAIVTLCAIGWYFAGVLATAGDWTWPATLARLERALFEVDFKNNAAKAIGLTTLALRAGMPSAIVAALATLVVAATLPALKRTPNREVYAAACLVGLVVSPHAWGYDAMLLLPMIFTALTTLREPERTRIVCAAYATAPMLLLANTFGFSPLAIVTIGAFMYWFALRSSAIVRNPQRTA